MSSALPPWALPVRSLTAVTSCGIVSECVGDACSASATAGIAPWATSSEASH